MADGVIVSHGIHLVRPAPALAPYVRFYGHRSAQLFNTVVVHPVHARAAPILEFEFGDANVSFVPANGLVFPTLRSTLVGMQTGRRGELHISGTVDSCAIVFQPNALDLLFRLPAQEITDRDFEAASVLGPWVARFEQQLGHCRSFAERVAVANQVLLQRVPQTRLRNGVTAAVGQMLSGSEAVSLSAMAGRAGWSERQFRRNFAQSVGVSPKLFARIARFEGALDAMARSATGSWTEVAHRFGYYDQMHLVHEFALFTGETPSRTLSKFEVAFQPQVIAARSGKARRPDEDRWVL
jgi:AraC-like DNA-binding protein